MRICLDQLLEDMWRDITGVRNSNITCQKIVRAVLVKMGDFFLDSSNMLETRSNNPV
jgi:hypothetical protein